MAVAAPLADGDLHDTSKDSWWQWFKWIPTSNDKLVQAENKILERCKCKLEKFFVPIFDSTFYLRTIVARNYLTNAHENECEKRVPILLIHGFASGVGLWCKNLDSLSKTRRVYAFDLLGFGRSSRPPFPETAEEVENKFVEVIEEWRKRMDLDKFILLGHSMGGFLAASYALSHPQSIVHLVLIDPWGFVGKDESFHKPPDGVRGWLLKKLTSFRALTTMRMIGPFGLHAMRSMRQDIEQIYSEPALSSEETSGLDRESLDDSMENPWSSGEAQLKIGKSKCDDIEKLSPYDPSVVYNYIYHINCRHPTGEDAFRNLSQMLGWAARPMLPRISQAATDLPITFIYGGRSWIDMSSGLRIRTLRPNSYVDVMVIEGGGHYAYAQYAEDFNSYVNAIAGLVDIGHVFVPGSEALVQKAVATPNHITDYLPSSEKSPISSPKVLSPSN
ncbi:unnamed protein product [Hymenolepis diminuta]|uniref:AB hydrolase-1 domain-containing protein n=1 Tax=Hymenolepis diminuta TaxID=6216 RepID=A0A564YI81_HYMDI|nr:unnamed protein product [Hymenolepis diminuta]